MNGRRRVVPHLAADGKRQRRYDSRRADTEALRCDTEAETRSAVTVAAVVNTLHRLGARGVDFDGGPAGTLRYCWTFAAKMQDGTVHTGQHITGLIHEDEVGQALMHAGAACIRSILEAVPA